MRRSSPISFLQDHHVLPQTELCRADIGFVFGNKHLCNELADTAARFYHQGYFEKILVSGGVETQSGDIEADAIAKRLIQRDVPANALILERASTHTGENVEFSLPLLREEFGQVSGLKSIGFGHFAAGPRFLMTVARHAPEIMAMHKSVFPDGYGSDNWHCHDDLVAKVIEERRKIPDYLQKDFLAAVDIPSLNKSIAALRPESKTSAPALAFG